MPPKVLYFDLGNVLMSFSHDRMCRQMAAVAGISPEAMRDAIFGKESQAAQIQFETGLISTDEFFDFICRATGTRPDREKLAHACCDIFEPIEPMWELVRRLAAAGYRMAILSNTNPVQWEFIVDGRFELIAGIGQPGCPFSWAILSYEVRSMKPDRAIYDVAIRRAGVAPEEMFFVDDRPENVVGAQAVGIDAVQFTEFDQFEADLHARGILSY